MKLPKIVWILWRDALAGRAAWEEINELKKCLSEERDLMEAVGFLVQEDKRYVTICETLHYSEENIVSNVGEIFSIPQGCIIARKTIEVSEMRKQKINNIRKQKC